MNVDKIAVLGDVVSGFYVCVCVWMCVGCVIWQCGGVSDMPIRKSICIRAHLEQMLIYSPLWDQDCS
jgi:hypothetical protein